MVKQFEAITGLVERVKDKGTGIKVSDEWCNVSTYHALAQQPKTGQRVNMNVQRTDRGVWIHSVDVLDDGQVHELPRPLRRNFGSGRSPAGSRDIRRLSVLKAAAGFAASRPDLKSVDVLVIAGRWLAWVEEPEQNGGDQATQQPLDRRSGDRGGSDTSAAHSHRTQGLEKERCNGSLRPRPTSAPASTKGSTVTQAQSPN